MTDPGQNSQGRDGRHCHRLLSGIVNGILLRVLSAVRGPTVPDRRAIANGRYRGAADGGHQLFYDWQKLGLDRPWSACQSNGRS